MKTRLEIMTDLIDMQNAKIISCEVDLITYNRKNLIVKDAKETAFYQQKIKELEAIKKRAEETIEILNDMIKKEATKDGKAVN
jgi:hypothetical protein